MFTICIEYAEKCIPCKKQKVIADIEIEKVLRIHKLEDCNEQEAELYEEQVLLARSKQQYWLKMEQIQTLREAIHFWKCKAARSKKKYCDSKHSQKSIQ